MTHPAHDFPQKLFEIIKNAVGVLLLIVLFYILQHIFDADFACSCQQTTSIHPAGVLYMLVPPLILTWVISIIESFNQRRIFSRIQNLSHNKACSYLIKVFINYVSLTAVWMATVFIDGDWYFCLKTNQNLNQTGLPCKNQEKLSDEEIRIKAAYASFSHGIGFCLMAAVIGGWTLVEFCQRIRKCRNWSCWEKCPPQYEVVYEDLLAEQLSQHLEEELTKIAKERVKAICEPYLHVIEVHEKPLNNAGADGAGADGAGAAITLREAWQKISASDFCLKSEEQVA